jgi:hypothetical protein
VLDEAGTMSLRGRGVARAALLALVVAAGCTALNGALPPSDGGAGRGGGAGTRATGAAGIGGAGGAQATGAAGTQGTAGASAGAGAAGSAVAGAGGSTGTAGTAGGTAGAAGMGGASGAGGAGGSGTAGAGGSAVECAANETQCSGDKLQTCQGQTWSLPAPCMGAHQACRVTAGKAACSCTVDAVCVASGPTCGGTSLTSCARDGQGCYYATSSAPCSTNACGGPPGSAACCTNKCTTSQNLCLSSTSVRACVPAADGCLDLATSSCGSGTICERVAPASCTDPSWAEWPIPNSATDVAAGAPNAQSYTDNHDGTVTDNITKLMWQQSIDAARLDTPLTAGPTCAALRLGGYSDWRAPTRIELVSIIDYGRTAPALDPVFGTHSLPFGASTEVATMPGKYWEVEFYGTGEQFWAATNENVAVRCVR